jgi:23S rRNA-/tRNA-specific pseudouridylate synthase
VVVPGRGVPSPTLLDLAKNQFGKGILPVHRLDRGTEGCLILAKTPFGEHVLSDAFRRHLVKKRYLAVVEGEPKFTRETVDARLLRVDTPDARKGPLAHQTINPVGQSAQTVLRVWATGGGLAVIEARPETGRMHQIRAHLAHTGHPLVGDAAYGATQSFPGGEFPLWAWALSFPQPRAGRAFVTSPMPALFRNFIDAASLDIAARLREELKRFAPAKKKAKKRPAKTSQNAKGQPAGGRGGKKPPRATPGRKSTHRGR